MLAWKEAVMEMTLISRGCLAGMRAFARKHPDLLEGQAPTLASPRYAASSVGTATPALTDISSELPHGRLHAGMISISRVGCICMV